MSTNLTIDGDTSISPEQWAGMVALLHEHQPCADIALMLGLDHKPATRDEATRTRGSLDTPIHTHTIAGRRIA